MKKHFLKRVWCLMLALFAMMPLFADDWQVDGKTKYRIQCKYTDGFVSVGSEQGVSYPVYYQTDGDVTEDGWWTIERAGESEEGDATYYICNAQTGQWLCWTDDYSSDRYMNLSDEKTDECLWYINRNSGDWMGIINAAQSSYSWNLRVGTHQLGCYSSSPGSNNSLFAFYDESGETLPEPGVVYIDELKLNYSALKMPVGSSLQLTYTYLPEDATRKTVTWTSDDSEVIKVVDGRLMAMAAGNSFVTLTAIGDRASAVCQVEVYNPERPALEGGDTLFVFQANGRMEAFPEVLMQEKLLDASGNLRVTMMDGSVWNYDARDLDSITSTFRGKLPELTSYKFNNKFNDQLTKDIVPATLSRTVDGVTETYMPDVIDAYVTGAIGKRLTASFKTSTDDCAVYVGGVEQQSKVSRLRFDGAPVEYVVAPRYYKVYSCVLKAIYDMSDAANPKVIEGGATNYEMLPFGHRYTVNVTWATDNSTSEYNVPTMYITTNDGQMITSKTEYKEGTISIDGAGVYDDLPETSFLIKGRGNTSWGGGYSKEPYHFKFDVKTKVLGLTKGKHWVLLANKQSGSMTTNALAMKMADMVQSAACNHIIPVELYLNGEYRGSYNLTEKIGFSNNSVDLADESGAVLLQLDSYYDETYKFRDDWYKLPTMVMEPDLVELKETDPTATANEFDAIQQHWNAFTTSVKQGDFDDRLDADAYARAMFVTDFARNQELKHPKSWYVYNENALASNGDGTFSLNEESPYVFGPVWDFDWAYGYDGTYQYFISSADEDIFTSSTSSTFFKTLLRNSEEVKKAYYRIWYKFMNEGGLDELLEYCDDYYQFVAPSFVHNSSKWSDGRNYASTTSNAKTWLKKRAEYLFGSLEEYDITDEPVIELGDVNEDGAITTADLVCALNYIQGIANDNFSFRQADTDKNDLVTMRDVAALVNMVFGQQANRVRQMRLPQAEATVRMSPFEARVGQRALMPLMLSIGEGAYSGVQMDIVLPEGCEAGDVLLPESLEGYTAQLQWVADRTYRLMVYNSARQPMPTGRMLLQVEMTPEHPIADASCIVSLVDPQLVSTDAEDFRMACTSVHFNLAGETDGVQMAQSQTSSAVRTYDLSGRLVDQPAQRGIYLKNGRKVVIR